MPQQQTSQSSSGSSRKAGGGQKNNNNSSKNSKGRKSNNSSSSKIDENNRDDVDGQAQLSSNKQRQRQRKKNNGSEDNNNTAADNNEMKGSHTQTKKNTSKAKKDPPRHNHNTANRNDEATTMVDDSDGKKQSPNRSNNKQSASFSKRQNQKSNGKKKGTDKKDDETKSSSSNTSNSDNKNNTSGDNTTAANKKKKRTSRTKKINYPPHATHTSCLQRYNSSMSISSTTSSIISSTSSTITTTTGKQIIRGKLRALPSSSNNNYNRGNANNKSKANAFVTCDRGLLVRDVVIQNDVDRNRALDGDFVFVELLDDDDGGEVVNDDEDQKQRSKDVTMGEYMDQLNLNVDEISDSCRAEMESDGDIQEEEEEGGRWHDDEVQMKLWDPVLNLRKKSKKQNSNVDGGNNISNEANGERQYSGRVICIVPPSGASGQQASEFKPEDESYKKQIPKRTIVGTLSKLPDGNRYLLVPNNKCLPRFMCPAGTKEVEEEGKDDANADEIVEKSRMLYQAEYVFGSWSSMSKWPPCTNVRKLCGSCNVEDETKALLVENGVDHGDFPAAVLRDVDKAVKSGRFLENNKSSDGAVENDMGWKPTEEMCRGRRDYRNHRIFTIDPTTAKDLDDALHVTPLPDGRVEIGVHIADVSHFIQAGSAVDQEALRRATTVYLVNDVIPMLPRPLCEIACSLNENVERLAFSVVWRMNLDGTLSKKGRKGKNKPKAEDEIWYGRTVIKSCARLDYATAQNIIDGKVATGELQADETFWPKSRQPTGGHTIDQVAADVRLMHKVAMARRQLRFGNGALALNGIKLAFQLEEDRETPKLCAPYPIRDSNRLIEEYMLLANYFVAQRLITHAHGRALLRNHSPPIELGMQSVVDVSKEALNFDIDTTSSSTLQASLSRLSRECDDELVVQCITESLMTPMKPAEYIAAGELAEEDWHHFALNIPYYTHFTSPIRRYPDVIVHRLLQATIDDNVDEFPQNQGEIHSAAGHCNDKRMAAKKAQERSDRVFLSLYLKKNPITSTLGVCLSVGEKTFTVFVPKLGASIKVFLQEHEDCFETNAYTDDGGKRHIVISPKTDAVPGMQQSDDDTGPSWKSLNIGVFTKLEVACTCKARPPIDVRVKVVGPWKE